jgi:hypothetical protein
LCSSLQDEKAARNPKISRHFCHDQTCAPFVTWHDWRTAPKVNENKALDGCGFRHPACI